MAKATKRKAAPKQKRVDPYREDVLLERELKRNVARQKRIRALARALVAAKAAAERELQQFVNFLRARDAEEDGEQGRPAAVNE